LPLAAASAPGRRGGRLQGWIYAGAASGNLSDDLYGCCSIKGLLGLV